MLRGSKWNRHCRRGSKWNRHCRRGSKRKRALPARQQEEAGTARLPNNQNPIKHCIYKGEDKP